MTTKKSGKLRGNKERPIFELIRKQIAPPGKTIGQAKPDELARPARRKVKHKQHAKQDADSEIS